MKALFLVDVPHDQNLPPMDGGGWWCVGNVPETNVVIVCVDTTQDILDQMAADDTHLCYYGDLLDEPAPGVLRTLWSGMLAVVKVKAKPRKKPDKLKVEQWMKARGHRSMQTDESLTDYIKRVQKLDDNDRAKIAVK